jgi:hypothetical protein
LRSQLESPGFWQPHDRLKATRLLGRQPVEANDDRRVATIFVASHALGPAGKTAFHDLVSDMEDEQRSRYGKAVRERWPDLFGTREKEEWRQMLLALADQNIERLNAKLEVHERNADAQAERTFARLSFDPSPEGEALRKHLIKCTNALFRGMANYRKCQATTRDRRDVASGVGRHGMQPDWSGDPGREAHHRAGSELGGDDSFGSGEGQDDRLEPAYAIDPDGVEQHGDELSGTGEIGENAPSEANFDETMSVVEAQELVQVTANSAALSGLDNGAAQPGEDSTPEQGKAQGSASEDANPDQETPDSSDPACGGTLPAAVSKREKRRLRDKERRAVEKMVEDMLSKGNYTPGEILMSALKLPLSGFRGP